jgi:hypothetical protein
LLQVQLRPERIRVETGEFAGKPGHQRLEDVAYAVRGHAPVVGGYRLFLRPDGRRPRQVFRRGVHGDQALHADVFICPYRPAGRVGFIDIYLIGEQPPPLRVPLGARAVDGSELADPDRQVPLPHVPGHRLVLRFDGVFVHLSRIRTATGEARLGILMDRVHRVVEGGAEEGELPRIAIPVKEDDVLPVHGPDRRDCAAVEVHKRGARLVGRLVEHVVTRDLGTAGIPGRDRLPPHDRPVLKRPLLPEQRPVERVVAVPVVVLPARGGVQVDHGVKARRGARVDRSVKVREPLRPDLPGPHVVFPVAVVHRDTDAVQAERRDELRVLAAEEARQERVEEQLVAPLPEGPQHRLAMRGLRGRVAGDEVLHVEPSAYPHAPQPDGSTVLGDDRGAGRIEPFHRLTVPPISGPGAGAG